MKTNLHQSELRAPNFSVKKIWVAPSVEIISESNIQSGFVGTGVEGQLTKSFTTPTFNDKYHS
jgi:hypothetical protein